MKFETEHITRKRKTVSASPPWKATKEKEKRKEK